jgi:hypothetical protein
VDPAPAPLLSAAGIEKDDAFIAGVGLPIKIPLGRRVAFISGSTRARGFGSEPLITASAMASGVTSTLAAYGSLFTEDLLSVITFSTEQQGSTPSTRVVGGVLHVPVGLLVEPASWLALSVRTGYRLAFSHVDGGGNNSDVAPSTKLVHYVPLAIDLVVMPFRRLELGFTATIYGPVKSDLSDDTAAKHWSDLSRFDFWIAVHI